MLLADFGNEPYGRNLNFMEYALLPPEALMAMQAGQGGGGGGASVEAEKEALKAQGKYYGAGEGPSLEELEDAWCGYFTWAQSESGHQTKLSFRGRDGYFETARMAIETACTLLFDFDKLRFRGGVLTPTVSGGEHLLKRITRSGMVLERGRWPEAHECKPPPLPAGPALWGP